MADKVITFTSVGACPCCGATCLLTIPIGAPSAASPYPDLAAANAAFAAQVSGCVAFITKSGGEVVNSFGTAVGTPNQLGLSADANLSIDIWAGLHLAAGPLSIAFTVGDSATPCVVNTYPNPSGAPTSRTITVAGSVLVDGSTKTIEVTGTVNITLGTGGLNSPTGVSTLDTSGLVIKRYTYPGHVLIDALSVASQVISGLLMPTPPVSGNTYQTGNLGQSVAAIHATGYPSSNIPLVRQGAAADLPIFCPGSFSCAVDNRAFSVALYDCSTMVSSGFTPVASGGSSSASGTITLTVPSSGDYVIEISATGPDGTTSLTATISAASLSSNPVVALYGGGPTQLACPP